ncbi:MAG TPA: restriction endonuclease subunit S [Gemmatirosa sp.]
MTEQLTASAWPRVPIVDLCEDHVDCVNRTAPVVHEPTDYKMIRTTNVTRGFIDVENVRYVSEATYRKWTRRLVPKRGDVVLTREAPLGDVGKIRSDDRIFLGQRLYHFRPNTQQLDPDFLVYALLSPDLQRQIRSFGSGSTVEHMRLQDIPNLEVAIPPIALQRRIAGVLAAYDDLIENCQRRIQILETMARALYREWFVEFRFRRHEDDARDTTDEGSVRRAWNGHFRDLATLERDGINPFEFPDEEFAHYSIPAFDDGRQPSIELGATILSGKYRVNGSAVLLSKLNPRIPRVWLPEPNGKHRAITSTEFLVLRPRVGVSREFLYAKCCSEDFAGQFGSLAIGTSTSHQRVKPDGLLALPSVVPDREAIARFTDATAPMLKFGETLRTEIANLRATRDLLLPRLLSGQLALAETEAAVP